MTRTRNVGGDYVGTDSSGRQPTSDTETPDSRKSGGDERAADDEVGRSQSDTASASAGPIITGSDYARATGERLEDTLNLDTWAPAERLAETFARLEEEVQRATADERDMLGRIRSAVLPRLRTRIGAPSQAGVYRATIEDVRRAQISVLFNGQVEACDGTSIVYDTLPVTIVQIGVSMVAYRGDLGTWTHRLYRRDMRVRGRGSIEDETLEFLDRRQRRGGVDQPSQRDQMTDMFRRAIMTFAERAVLADRCSAPWKLGHGNPLAYELLTGSGSAELIVRSLPVLQRLILQQKKFVFVPSAPAERALITIGNALEPLEYAVIDSMADRLQRVIEGHYRGDAFVEAKRQLESFVAEAGPAVLIGVYRVSRHSPAQVFFAHADHVSEAALIAMADSILQDHRGFPMLLDLADTTCANLMGPETLLRPVQAAYAAAGEPMRFRPERDTRR